MAWVMYIPTEGGTQQMWLRYNKKFKNWEPAKSKQKATKIKSYLEAYSTATKILESPYMIGDRIYIEEDT